jgi:hypothetical protein
LQTNPDGTVTGVQDSDELAETLSQRNRKHFSQAHGTPFTIPPLSNILSFSGVSQAGLDVLQGDLTKANHETLHTNAILQELKQVREVQPHELTFRTMIVGFSKWRETTTTSPSGKHLGLYKSLIRHYKYITSIQKHQTQTSTTTRHPDDNTSLIAL